MSQGRTTTLRFHRLPLRWWRVLMGVWLCLCAGLLGAQPLVHITQAEVMAVEGRGYSRPPYSMTGDALPGPWQPVTLPRAVRPSRVDDVLSDHTVASPTVLEWYRLKVPPLEPSGSTVEPPELLALYLPRWKADGSLAIYGDGRLLYQSHAGVVWNGWNIPLRIVLNETAGAQPPRELLFRLERPRYTGGGISTVWVGPEQSLDRPYRLRELIQVHIPALSSAAFLAVGVFSLLVWFRERREPLYQLFFWVSLASYMRTMHFHVGAERLPIPEEWFSWLTVNSLYWMVSLVHFFLNKLHGHPTPWLDRMMVLTPALLSASTLPPPWTLVDAHAVAALSNIALLCMGFVAAVVNLRKSRQHHSRDGVLLSSWGLLSMLLGIDDALMQGNLVDIEGIYFGPYSNVLAFLMLAFIMYRRYVEAILAARQANFTLALRLAEREDELTASHQRLREIEQRELLGRERARLMQDMHDGMGSSLRTALWAVENGQQDEAALADILKNCIDDLKLAIDSMEPVQTDLLLLLATWRFRLEPRLHNTGIRLRWDVTDVPPLPWLEPASALHILRILQEALANIIKHAQATEIRVTTGTEDGGVWLSIDDNGMGLPQGVWEEAGSAIQPIPPGHGLRNMRRRAQVLHATLSMGPAQQTTPPGTRMRLWLPLQATQHSTPLSPERR